MYFPQSLRERATGPGSVLVGGTAALSLAFGVYAAGLVGIAVALGVLLLLFFAEVWRDAAVLSGQVEQLEDELEASQLEVSAADRLRARVEAQDAEIEELRRDRRRPTLGQEELLESVSIHLMLIEMAQKHRTLVASVSDMPVTRMESLDSGDVSVTAVAGENAELLVGELMSIVDIDTDASYASGLVSGVEGHQVRVESLAGGLPNGLLEELAEQTSFHPRGYVLRLAGLCLPRYQALDQPELEEVKHALSEVSKALTRTMTPTSDHERLELLEGEVQGADSTAWAVEKKERNHD